MKTMQTGVITRRGILAAGAALPAFGIISRRGDAAEFTYKFATGQDPTHPVNIRAQEAIDRIRKRAAAVWKCASSPRTSSAPTPTCSRRSATAASSSSICPASILATLVPAAAIVNTGFAFHDYDAVWKAMDGDLGAYIRAQIAKSRTVRRWPSWDNGFRQITTSTKPIKTPDDLQGLEDPRPARADADLAVQGARRRRPRRSTSTSSIPRCRPRSSRARKIRWRSSPPRGSTRCRNTASLTGHIWDGYWIPGNRRAWERLPEDLRDIVAHEFDKSGMRSARISRSSASTAHGSHRQGHAVQRGGPQKRSGTRRTRPASSRSGSEIRPGGLGLLEKYVWGAGVAIMAHTRNGASSASRLPDATAPAGCWAASR